MKFEFENGTMVGTAEWRGPGQVALDMPDSRFETWFRNYFESEQSYLSGSVDCPDMVSERPDSSAEAFRRAANRLASHKFAVHEADDAALGWQR